MKSKDHPSVVIKVLNKNFKEIKFDQSNCILSLGSAVKDIEISSDKRGKPIISLNKSSILYSFSLGYLRRLFIFVHISIVYPKYICTHPSYS